MSFLHPCSKYKDGGKSMEKDKLYELWKNADEESKSDAVQILMQEQQVLDVPYQNC